MGRSGRFSAVKAHRAAALGNSVKAAILQVRANDAQGGSSQGPSFRFATEELRSMVLRLQPVLQLTPPEVEEWCLALIRCSFQRLAEFGPTKRGSYMTFKRFALSTSEVFSNWI